MKNVLDEASHGVVYVNFGTNLRSSDLPVEKRNSFLNAFKKLKQTIIWKWEGQKLENKSDNVFTRAWLPQIDVFGKYYIIMYYMH